MFQTDSEWENSGAAVEMLRSITKRPGLRQYPIIEVAPCTLVFHIEISFRNGGAQEGMSTRYFCAGFEALLNFFGLEDVTEISVTVMLKSASDDTYDCSVVNEIRKTISPTQEQYFCVLDDGRSYPLTDDSENHLKTICIFQRKARK